MANIGRRCTIEVAERSIPKQNRPPNRFLASSLAVDYSIANVFGLEVERRSTPGNYTARGKPLFEPQISLRNPAEDVSREQFD